jgi:rare lipoprotein A
MRNLSVTKLVIVLTFSFNLTACSSFSVFEKQDGAPNRHVDVNKINSAVPKTEPLCKYGNPSSYTVNGNYYRTLKSSKGYEETGIASWYGTKFHNVLTSCREPYDMYKMTAAHTTLPLPTYVKVTNLENGKQIIVRVNDRGPFEKNRLIDLSYVAAKKLGILAKGTGLVRVTAIDPNTPKKISTKTIKISPQKRPKIYLQVGAFKNLQNANALASKINNSITAASCRVYSGHDSNKQLIYRVQVGPITKVNTADKITEQLENSFKGAKPHAVVNLGGSA